MNIDNFQIDLNCFDEILPESSQYNIPSIRANPSGYISLSTKMRDKMQWHKVIFMTNQKADIILMKPSSNEKSCYSIPKNGAIVATKFTRELVKRGIRLPARYNMAWDDKHEVWVGFVDKKFTQMPPKVRRTQRASIPDLKDLV